MSESYFTWPGRRAHDPSHDRLAAFLAMDIQRSPEWAKDLRSKIDEIKSGARASWERVGNAYRLQLSGTGAWIEDLVDSRSSPHRVVLEEFEAAVNAWIEAIAHTSGMATPPDDVHRGERGCEREG